MSMRPAVDRPKLERFLQELGRRARVPVRLHLHGGAISLWQGVRGATIDIDYDAEVRAADTASWERTLRAVADEMDVNVEPAGPGDFIPLPDGWRNRSHFLGQYGSVAVYTFDPYSTALAKIAPGTRTDLEDVRHLLAAGEVDSSRLLAMADAILPRWNERIAHQPAAAFRAKVEALLTP